MVIKKKSNKSNKNKIDDSAKKNSKNANDSLVRIQKLLSDQGYGSRRALEKMISEKRIYVNGEPAVLGAKISGKEHIQIDKKKINVHQAKTSMRRVIAYHKIVGEICTQNDPEGRPTVFKSLPKLTGERWISVGRLDINTSGLLLFTNDGELAKRLMHPSYMIEREYAVRVFGTVTEEMVQNLVNGVQLEDGVGKFTDVVDSGGEGINHSFYVCLSEGRNREVRRLWESQGVQVNRLKRVRFGSFMLPINLRKGNYYTLNQKEVDTLVKTVDMDVVNVASETIKDKHELKRHQRKSKNL